MNPSIFKAYDIRGVYPSELNEEVAVRVASALHSLFHRGPIVVGHDARISSPALYHALLQGFALSHHAPRVIRAGIITTPMLTFLVHHFHATGGVMITASHNPKEYNGIKVVTAGGIPLSGKEIEQALRNTNP